MTWLQVGAETASTSMEDVVAIENFYHLPYESSHGGVFDLELFT